LTTLWLNDYQDQDRSLQAIGRIKNMSLYGRRYLVPFPRYSISVAYAE